MMLATSRSVRWLLLGSLVLVTLAVGVALSIYPAVVTTAGNAALVYLGLFVLAMMIYGWVALTRTRTTTPEQRIAVWQGSRWGLLCGGVWTVELIVANLLGPQ